MYIYHLIVLSKVSISSSIERKSSKLASRLNPHDLRSKVMAFSHFLFCNLPCDEQLKKNEILVLVIHLHYDWPEFINDIHVGRTILIFNPHPTDLPGLNLSWQVRNPPCLQVASEPHLSLTTTESFTGLKLRHTNYKLSKHTWHNDFFLL